jgi:hypothetical protein
MCPAPGIDPRALFYYAKMRNGDFCFLSSTNRKWIPVFIGMLGAATIPYFDGMLDTIPLLQKIIHFTVN